MSSNTLPNSDSGKETVRRLLGDARVTTGSTVVGSTELEPEDVVRRLAQFLTEDRKARIESVLDQRTYSVATVVEGLANSGNVSAVMRTAEGFGFQRFDLIKGSAPFKHSKRTTQGAEKWLDVRAWTTAEECGTALRGAGYRLVVTHLDDTAVPIDHLDFTQPTALVFGNELHGASQALLDLADARCMVPIAGFVQSFNISVAAAVGLYHVRQDRTRRLGRSGDLTSEERTMLRAEFYVRALSNSGAILERSLETDPPDFSDAPDPFGG